MPGYMNVTEAASYLAVSRRTVWRLISEGKLEAVSDPIDGRAKLVSRDDVERLAEYRRHGVGLTVREFEPGGTTNDLALQVERAATADEMRTVLQEKVDFLHDNRMPPSAIG